MLLTAASGCVGEKHDFNGNIKGEKGYIWKDYEDTTDSSLNTETEDQSTSNSKICPECDGTGVVECYNYKRDVESCAGTGRVTGGDTEGTKCRICDGTGQITCPKCDGTGKI